MFCTKCGAIIKDGFKFCPKCGASVQIAKIVQPDESAKSASSSGESLASQDLSISPDFIYLTCCFKETLLGLKNESIAVFVPDTVSNNLSLYSEDLKFYMQLLGISGNHFDYMMEILDSEYSLPIGELAMERKKMQVENMKINAAGAVFAGVFGDKIIYDDEGFLYDFTDSDELYLPHFGPTFMSGKAVAYWPKIKFSSEKKCYDYIEDLLLEIYQQAEQRWGSNFRRTHLNVVIMPSL